MKFELYRPQALEFARSGVNGDVILATPLNIRVMSTLSCLLAGGFVLFICTFSYARKETIPGWLVPQGGQIRIYARQGGTIEKLSAHEGETVERGSAIATIRLSDQVVQGDPGAALEATIEDQSRAAVQDSRASIAKLLEEQKSIAGQVAALHDEIAETATQGQLQTAQSELLQRQLNRSEQLQAQGYVSGTALDAKRASLLASRQEEARLSGERASLQRALVERKARAASIPMEVASAQAQATGRASEFSRMKVEAAIKDRYVVTAPVAGVVDAVNLHEGDGLPIGATVAVVTPREGSLQVELFATSKSVGFVRSGQQVRLSFAAFPREKFGVARGVVRSVSRSPIAPMETGLPGLQIGEPVYRVGVDLVEEPFARLAGRRVAPGMLVSADIVQERRRLVEWMLGPLFSAGRGL